MKNGDMKLSKESFMKMLSDDRDWLFYENLVDHMRTSHKRLCALEKRKKIDTTIAAGSGFAGGFAAFFTAILTKIKIGE